MQDKGGFWTKSLTNWGFKDNRTGTLKVQNRSFILEKDLMSEKVRKVGGEQLLAKYQDSWCNSVCNVYSGASSCVAELSDSRRIFVASLVVRKGSKKLLEKRQELAILLRMVR